MVLRHAGSPKMLDAMDDLLQPGFEAVLPTSVHAIQQRCWGGGSGSCLHRKTSASAIHDGPQPEYPAHHASITHA